MSLRSAIALLPAFGLAACSTLETLPVVSELPKVPVPAVLHIEDTVDAPKSPIQRALSGCDKRTEDGEAACVKAALVAADTSVPALVGMMGGGCRIGQVCHLFYTTEDVVGFYRATASHFVAHWRVDVDLRHTAATAAAVPITVAQV